MATELDASNAFAAALIAGGITFVASFPGSPTTNLALHLEAHGLELGVEFRWAINENVALSQAFGAAMAGRGAAVLVKHVGVNVLADALQVMGVVHGLAAPLLLIEGADAKPGSSQSAQDNRSLYAGSPQLLVLAPTSPAEITAMVADACAISRAAGMLVVVRGDARCFASRGPGALPEPRTLAPVYPAWPDRGFALATSARTYASHLELRRDAFARLRPWIDQQVVGYGLRDPGPIAVVIAGHLGVETESAVRERGLATLRLTLEHPIPEKHLLELAAEVETLAVLEECTPTLELQIRALVQRAGLTTKILGRSELGDPRPIGRLDGDPLATVLDQLELRSVRSGDATPLVRVRRGPDELDHRPLDPASLLDNFAEAIDQARRALDQHKPASGFPANDPRQALFAQLRALAPRTFIATDPGITGVLALAEHGCDVKMHMGGAVPIAAGWSRGSPPGSGTLAIAVVGDTNLPHSEWLGLLDAVAHADDVLVVIADNGASEMTSRVVTPRLAPAVARASLEAAGIPCSVATASLSLADPWTEVLRDAARATGTRVVWVELPSLDRRPPAGLGHNQDSPPPRLSSRGQSSD